nr:porin [Acinetobacter sp. Marseille-Q1620]
MIKMTINSLILGYFSSTLAHAEIDVISKDQFKNQYLSPLSFQFGGQLRPQWIHNMGDEPGYYRDGHDGLSRLRFTTNYELSEQTKLLGYYELGINVPKILDMDGHYKEGAKRTVRRLAYVGVENSQYGTLTYGQQYGLYYAMIGLKSDVWDNDGHAGATAIGVNGHYDGANRAKNSLMYTNTFGKYKLYVNYLFPERAIDVDSEHDYRRKHGEGIGLDYNLNKKTTLSLAYSSTNAKMGDSLGNKKNYHQNILGSAITFTPHNWYLVGTASYYNDFVPATENRHINHYFVGDGYGLEGFAGYTFKLDKPFLKSMQPFIAADRLNLNASDHDYHANHQYVGLSTNLGHGVKVIAEHTFAQTTDDAEKDSTWLTFFISF